MGRDGAKSVEDGPSTSQFHVLAVDDSILDRKVIEMVLKRSAIKVTTVDSATRALDLLLGQASCKINMIITDYSMPVMTGYDLLKKIKESASLKEIPVVIMSSENVMTRIDRCLEEGAEEFILKPVKLSDVSRLKGHITKGISKQLSITTTSSSFKRKAMEDSLDCHPAPQRSRVEEQMSSQGGHRTPHEEESQCKL